MLNRVREIIADRKSRMRMNEAAYWDDRARSRQGHARSVWHAQHFSEAWTQRQEVLLRSALDDLLGSPVDKKILEVGCGTGRIARLLARLGAQMTAVDFAPAAVEAAREETKPTGLEVRYEVADVAQPPMPIEDGSFDAVITVSCLAVACTDLAALQASLVDIRRVLRPSGVLILLEPIHSSRLLGRVLKAPVGAWIDAAHAAGLRLARRRGMGFVPVRLALSSFDMPDWIVTPTFRAGEIALESFPKAMRLADYSLLCFRVPTIDD